MPAPLTCLTGVCQRHHFAGLVQGVFSAWAENRSLLRPTTQEPGDDEEDSSLFGLRFLVKLNQGVMSKLMAAVSIRREYRNVGKIAQSLEIHDMSVGVGDG